MTSTDKIEKFFCNQCKGKTNHFIRGEYTTNDEDEHGVGTTQRLFIIQCCGCEYAAFVRKSHFSEDVDYDHDPRTGAPMMIPLWEEEIYPPTTYRSPPTWFEDLPDQTLRMISKEIYKSLQTESYYLATFGSRTLIDRLIVLTVGDRGNFEKGLTALQEEGKLSKHERETLEPVIQAGHAAAHRGWKPNKEQLATILDTVEELIHRLLVLPKLSEELDGAVPSRKGAANEKPKVGKPTATMKNKLESSPKELRDIYDDLENYLKSFGSDVAVLPQKHYMAFRRNRNFACVQLYNQKKVIRVYLNLDPDAVTIDKSYIRDVRQIGHFGTGDLEVTIKSKKDIEKASHLFIESYKAS